MATPLVSIVFGVICVLANAAKLPDGGATFLQIGRNPSKHLYKGFKLAWPQFQYFGNQPYNPYYGNVANNFVIPPGCVYCPQPQPQPLMVPAPNYWYPGLGKSSLTQSSASHFRAVGVVQLYQDLPESSSESEEDIPEKKYPEPTENEQVLDGTTSSRDMVQVPPKPGSDEYNSLPSSELTYRRQPDVIPPKTGSDEYNSLPSSELTFTRRPVVIPPKTEVDNGDVSSEEVLPKQTVDPTVVKPNDNDNDEDSGSSESSDESNDKSVLLPQKKVDEDNDNDVGKSDDVPETKDPVTGKPVKDLKQGILFPVEYYK